MARLCRDCLAELPDAPAARRCPRCGGPRLVAHAELFDLAIAHIDCDAFYASVEKRDNPALREKPVIVGGGRRGVVSAACYVARRYGVRSAMPMFKALKACPDAVVVRPDMAKYAAVGRQVRDLMLTCTPALEPVSIDEAFLDLSGTMRLHRAPPAATLARLALRIEREVGVTVSVGLSYCKFLAKLGSDFDKPRGFFVVGRAEARGFLAKLPVRLLWGVGAKSEAALKRDGIATIGEIQTMAERDLIAAYGSLGSRLFHLSRGEDERGVERDRDTKGASAETTFDGDIADFTELRRRLWLQCETLSARLKDDGIAGKGITLKLKTADFRLITRALALDAPSQLAETIFAAAEPLLRREATGTAFRLIGIGVHGIVPADAADPGDLFAPDGGKRAKTERAMDKVRAKLGDAAIEKGRGIKKTKPAPDRR